MSATVGPIRIATRGSALALWQAEYVAAELRTIISGGGQPDVAVELVVISTEGDRRTDVPLAEIGGKGVFVKEVQAAVLDGRADVAVHSAKDLPAVTPDGLVVGAVPPRADPRDVLVGSTLADLAPGAVVASGSPRRRAQLADHRPDLRFAELRGNIDTRLGKIGEVDAIVMAAAAIDRLGRTVERFEILGADTMIPQVGQGALAIECRADDALLVTVLGALDHGPSRRAFMAERAFLQRLGGDCDLPAGAFAELTGDGRVSLSGMLADHTVAPGSLDGDRAIVHRASDSDVDGLVLGARVAQRLLDAVSSQNGAG